ncbi:phosphoenolpyruvate--protein phosphotransferase [Ornithinimicrobium cerasi]|uniref:Phosphocarrier protein HPr n=1 Tax=Ornithinimicrobium cerasi TaxID=2248773 RepID=A0A285VM66_9MICO|nr:phosphoenolpyruvate--protein phosphotransferase [Ornithinimicrobium cerasi]SOC54977.1 Phosphocarrier protein HPr /phosphoenolpyruvate--protein phosphotransferase /dihydroxyacetone kinase DhaM subunit [Ornithinimicrobium cerasi]
MISVVVVSHSRALADAAVALAAQMAPGPDGPRVEVAAGLDDGTLGTDAAAVAAAIRRGDEASGHEGVLVLMDLGSAVLSAELALELLGPEVAGRVRLSPAPLVEGLVVAVVSARSGRDLGEVAAEAAGGLGPKTAHLLPDDGAGPCPEEPGVTGPTTSPQRVDAVELEVRGPHGLHARPAARLVACAAEVAPRTTVRVRNLTSGRGPVDALSLSRVATLDARQGHLLLAEASGPRAREVLESLTELARDGFGDLPRSGAVAEAAAVVDTTGGGVAGSGLDAAVGPVLRLDARLDGHDIPAGSVAEERVRWREALREAGERLDQLAEQARRQLGAPAAEVFEAHATLLRDPELARDVSRRLVEGQSAATAWAETVEATAAWFDQLADPYQRERAHDVRAAGERVLRLIVGAPEPESLGEGILVVEELDPGLAISLDPRAVRGVITWHGGETGHGVLIAVSRGVPVLTGEEALRDVPAGTTVAFDGRSRTVEVDPGEEVLAAFEELLDHRRRERDLALETSATPVVTTDGVPLRVRANVSSLAMARLAAQMGAQGAGLVRTEAVFGHCLQAPSVDEQAQVYGEIAAALAPHPVAIRTWDVGGDKPLPFMPTVVEANPFLGTRGLRAFVHDPRLLLDQLEAICRVAAHAEVQVLFPMVTTRSDVDLALALLREAATRAGGDGLPPLLEVGIMIEVPAAALNVSALTDGLDLVSIGSNDLSQYALAADRGNGDLAAWSDPLEPAVLRLVRATCEGVPAGMPVGLCGALAGEPGLAGLLAGLGVSQLSAVPAAVPLVKERLRAGSMAGFREIAERALDCADAASVRALLGQHADARRRESVSARPAGGTAR